MPGSLAYDHDIHASLRATVLEASRVLVPDCRTTAPLASRSRRRGNPGHGDMATNAALVAAKTARRAPSRLAAAIVELPRRAPVSNAGAAGPGFVNPGLDAAVLRLLLPDDWRARAGLGSTQRAAGVVADYVAGMTDRYAMDEHRRLTDLSVSG